MKAEIKNIEVQIGDSIVSFTEEEARALHAMLDELFGAKALTWRWYPTPVYPTYITTTPTWDTGTIMCGNNTSEAMS